VHTITAVIRCKKGSEETMRAALLAVAENVRRNEPETVGFFVSQDEDDPSLFTTYERFVDQAAMDRHNASDASKQFFVVAKPIIEGDVVLVKAREVSAKA
jgi:quinol monooxygenase YgiN